MKTSQTLVVGFGLIAGSLASLNASTYSSVVEGQNPFAYYRLDETSNTQPVADQQGANPGSYVNNPTVGVPGAIATDPSSTAVSFSASSSQYVQLTNFGNFGSSMTSGFTIDFWLKTTDSTDYQAIMGTANSGGLLTDFITDIAYSGQAGRLRLYYRDDNNNRYQTDFYPTGGNVNIFDGAWHQIVEEYNPTGGQPSNTVLFYIDGSQQTVTVTPLGGTPSSSNFNEPLTLGADNLRGTVEDFLQGSLDDVSFYNTTLSASQIASQYQAASVPEPAMGTTIAIGIALLGGLYRRDRRHIGDRI